jgi:hypothetical protein
LRRRSRDVIPSYLPVFLPGGEDIREENDGREDGREDGGNCKNEDRGVYERTAHFCLEMC